MTRRQIAIWVLAVISMALFGCAVDSHTRKQTMLSSYIGGNLPGAVEIAQDNWENGADKDKVMDGLELGYMYFLSGNYTESARILAKTEVIMEEKDSRALVSLRDVSQETYAMLSNLDKLDYRGSCRDRIMLHVIKALSYLGQGDIAAYNTEIFPMYRRMNDIQSKHRDIFEREAEEVRRLAQSPEIRHTVHEKMSQAPGLDDTVANLAVRNLLNPLALLMAGLARTGSGDWETGKIDFGYLYKAMPESRLASQLMREVMRRERKEIPSKFDNLPEPLFDLGGENVLVIFANGRGGALCEVKYDTALFKAAIPVPYFFKRTVSRGLEVQADGLVARTELIADMDGMLSWEYEMGYSTMIRKTILSSMIKEGISFGAAAAAYAAGKNAYGGRSYKSRESGMIAALIVYLMFECYKREVSIADTRSWETLPSNYQVAIVPMPKNRRLRLVPIGSGVAPVEVELPKSSGFAIIYASSCGAGDFRNVVLAK